MKNNVIFTIEQVDNKLIISAESVELEQTEQLDLSKYKAFPEGYVVPKGKEIRAVKVVPDDHIKYGAIGTITGDGTDVPLFKCDNKSDLPEDNEFGRVYEYIHYLAPLDPSDHPDYKDEQFDEDKEMPMSAEGIAQWVNDFDEFDLTDDLIKHINALVQYEVNKAKR